MRAIDINTSQNVSITYHLASVRERIMAFMIDLMVMFALIAGVNVVGGLFGAWGESSIFYYLTTVPIFVFYTLTLETLNDGQTIGKVAMSIRVAKLDGKKPKLGDYLLRWAFRMIDIYFSLGSIAVILINSSPQAQRIGGMVSNTTVIRIRPRFQLQLKDVLKIDSKATHEVLYPNVRHYKDADMLVVKKVIERYKKHPNDAHRTSVIDLATKMATQMELDEVPFKKLQFLKDILKDYVVLTRSV